MINSEGTFVSPLVKLLVMVVMALVLAAIAVYISRRRFDREGTTGDTATRASRGVQASTPDH
jgi:membrane protein implicated in regulation of membrane protease activity